VCHLWTVVDGGPAKRVDSDAKTAKLKQAKGSKETATLGKTASSDGETKEKDDKIKQLEKANVKMKKTVANMKKLSVSNKKAQQEVAALKAIIAKGGG
jgi:hypothetical protein